MKPRITEAEWLAADNVIAFDLYRSAWKQFRKWRLFGAACCRHAITLTPDARLETLAACAEHYADGLVTWDDVKNARRDILLIRKQLGARFFGPDEVMYDVLEALDVATKQTSTAPLGACHKAQLAFAAVSRPDYDAGLRRAEPEQVLLIRDIFGNPFRPVALDPAWRTSTAVALAQQMYDARDFGLMPILGDALQDAGCENEDILTHCRDANGTHVRGCWVVDLVLGKSA
jgi:hypothetical protein